MRYKFQEGFGNAGVFKRDALAIFTDDSRIRFFIIEWRIRFFAAIGGITPGNRFLKLFIDHVFPIVARAVLFMHNAASFRSLNLPLWNRSVIPLNT